VFSRAEIRVNLAVASILLFANLLVPRVVEAAAPSTCQGLSKVSFGARAQIISALPINATSEGNDLSWLPMRYQDSLRTVPPFCRIVVVSTPSVQSRIGVEVWLPLSGWNGRFLGTGSGGYPLAIEYRAMIEGLQKGFAVANTDLGLAAHVAELNAVQPASSDATTLFIDHPVRMIDFGSRATHEMTTIAKELTARFYRKPSVWSYFTGCSTGGMQALREVEQYPEDYNGVVAGDPGENRARVHLSILWDYMSVWHRPERILSKDQLEAMHSAVVSACSGTSKAPFLKEPRACTWRPDSLLCGALKGVCLTPAQVEAADMIYQGPRNPRTGEQYYPGLARGSELGWGLYMKQASQEPPFKGVFDFALGKEFQFQTFDWDRDAETFIDTVGPYFDAMNTDLTAFGRRGGKLLLYHGGSDPLASAEDTVNFYTKANNRGELAAGGPRAVSTYVLLYVLPGMDHCEGGLGPDYFDQMSAIMRWTEQRIAPVPLTVWKQEANGTVTRRRLCPYSPETARGTSRKKSHAECQEESVD
jgi:feruloyl esterase